MDHRPFWWVQETDVYGNEPRPVLRQTPLTCETGPGCPSGHVQGLSSLMYVVLQHFIRSFIKSNVKMDDRKKKCVRVALWTLFILLMILVGISRLYTATHFPHQALLGLLAGSVTLICKTVVWFCSVEMCCQFMQVEYVEMCCQFVQVEYRHSLTPAVSDLCNFPPKIKINIIIIIIIIITFIYMKIRFF